MNGRAERLRDQVNEDLRRPFQRDRDRVLYAPEFRRLSGVTQVASASEGDYFHNRLTHSLKVAQVGRRLAERLLEESPERVDIQDGLDPDVVETAGLAHDLGHPPFGHDGEKVICQAVDEEQGEGFEGNAQSFRIITRLASHTDNDPASGDDAGLNLTRATLNAILKYPWTRSKSNTKNDKWGVYGVDEDRFEWVRRGSTEDKLTLEAELMDWADDVTYAVHDLEDFYRVGLVPIHLLMSGAEHERFIEIVVQKDQFQSLGREEISGMLQTVLGPLALLDGPYDGSRRQRTIINEATSTLITQFITGRAIRVNELPAKKCLDIDREIRLQVELLKATTKYYVIDNPRIVSVREGQRELLRKLFCIFMEALEEKRNRALLPQATQDRLESGDGYPRLAADLLAGMTERQAIQTYQRLTGIVPGPAPYFDLWLL